MHFFKKIILLSYVSVASTESAMLTPAFPNIQNIFHLSNASLSALMTLFLIGYVLSQLAFGPLANRFGRLTCLRIGFMVNLLGIALGIAAGFLHDFHLLLLSRFITALGASVGLSGTFTLIHELMSEAEAKASLSYIILSFMFGMGFGVYIGGVLTQYFGWLSILEVMFIYGALTLFSTSLFKETLAIVQSINLQSILKGYWAGLQNTKLIRYSVVVGYNTAASYLYSTAAPLLSATYFHLNPHQFGNWNLLIMIGLLVGSLHGKKCIARFGMKSCLNMGLAGMGFCTLIFLAMFGFKLYFPIIFFLNALLLYYFGGFVFPCGSFFAMEGTTDRGNASGMMSFINLMTAVVALIFLGNLPFNILHNYLTLCVAGILLAGFLVSRGKQ